MNTKPSEGKVQSVCASVLGLCLRPSPEHVRGKLSKPTCYDIHNT